MSAPTPFILLDDAREADASDALLYENPDEIFIARQPDEVLPTLTAANAARISTGGHLAGYMAYEAGMAAEPRLAPLAAPRTGNDGPLVWFGLFEKVTQIPAAAMPQWLAQKSTGKAFIGPMEPQLAMGAYLTAFDRLQAMIHAGDIYQANLTFPLAGPAKGDPLALYAALRPAAAAGYGGVVFDGSHWLLSFSPELFFSLRQGAVKVKPMKGTRPRLADAEADLAMARTLSESTKDKAENLMIVDLMRNDLSRVAEAGSVEVEAPFAVETYPSVHQMVSSVHARMAEGKDAMDLLRALFPCGSITGAPKIRAMELIDELERDARGVYCGAIGRIDANGDAAFNVAIRTVRLTPGENEKHKATMGVGSAIVADSDAMSEWRECLVKSAFVRGAAGGHDLIETMRFDPETGIALLELHLERLKRSAAALGFAFDRHETRNRIQALCFDLDEAAKLRLLLARSGAIALDIQALPQTASAPVDCLPLPHPTMAGDWRLAHKSTDRGFYEEALDVARDHGAAEAVLIREDGQVTEGCWSTIFVQRDGLLLTPPVALGLLPGVLRRSLIEQGQAREHALMVDDLAKGFLIGNAVRGLMPARLSNP